MSAPVTIEIVRRFPHRAVDAYAWLTDFQDDDADRAGHAVVQSRTVKERSAGRIVYEGETSVMGVRARATTEVNLRPPDRWEARVIAGPRTGSTTDYHLRETPGGCELTVTYRFMLVDPKRHFVLRLLKPLVRRELRKMWSGFAEDMTRELRTGHAHGLSPPA